MSSVVYIRSRPEWYVHNVNDMFFRFPEWLFIPVQDLNLEDRLKEYKKAEYFFVSGFGNSEEAVRAFNAGCMLVGVQADVPANIPVISCTEWDPTDVFITFLFVEKLRKFFPAIFKSRSPNFTLTSAKFVKFSLRFFQLILRPIFKVFYLLRAALVTWKNQGAKHVLIKTRNYFRKVMHI